MCALLRTFKMITRKPQGADIVDSGVLLYIS